MRGVVICFSMLICACTTGADNQSSQTAVKEIEALYASWRQAVESSDIDGYLRVLHPNVRLLPPGAPAIDGAQSYREFLQPVFATATYEIEIDQLQIIDVVGDTAVAEYEYTILLHRKNPDVGVTEAGALTDDRTAARYFDVLRKTSDGGWRVWRHSWQTK
jgi:ketosteroid isomerase-like protein